MLLQHDAANPGPQISLPFDSGSKHTTLLHVGCWISIQLILPFLSRTYRQQRLSPSRTWLRCVRVSLLSIVVGGPGTHGTQSPGEAFVIGCKPWRGFPPELSYHTSGRNASCLVRRVSIEKCSPYRALPFRGEPTTDQATPFIQVPVQPRPGPSRPRQLPGRAWPLDRLHLTGVNRTGCL